jgi:hypothetical protein
MILVTTLIIMLIITIMGAGLLFTSQVELTTTSTYRQNLKAYNNADALARLAIMATDVIVSGTADSVSDHLSFGDSDFVIELNDTALNNLNADVSLERFSVKSRYLRLGSVDSPPDMIVRDKSGKLVGTIMISHDLDRSASGSSPSGGATVGGSAGIADMGSSGGTTSKQNYIITVSGRDPVYQAQSFFDDDELNVSGPQTFITILYTVVTTH